ncbi:MAG: hypothetical protein JXQ85_15060 [Cognatishimia sp.]|uniref:hypothetical protein n=1 Tax=Cognatishimia sp. TaxID=2211648 RepID=UPI003B8C8D19
MPKSILKHLSVMALSGATMLSATTAIAEMTAQDIKDGYKANAALAQFYRWFQFYERPQGGLENALDILADDVHVQSSLGEANGIGEYKARVESLPATWQNSHKINSVDVTITVDGAVSLAANVTYQNIGAAADGVISRADLSYAVTYDDGSAALPKITSVQITNNAQSASETYHDAYPENRVRSLVHRWLTIIENPVRDPEGFKEILAANPEINFSSGLIQDYDGLAAWLAGPGSQVAASTHIVKDLTVAEIEGGDWQTVMVFDWAGLLPDGTELIAKTQHTWVVDNDVTERFARVKSVNVEVLEPFRPKQ